MSLPYLLNRQGRYVKLNTYLLQFLCHSHDFWPQIFAHTYYYTQFYKYLYINTHIYLPFLCWKASTFMNWNNLGFVQKLQHLLWIKTTWAIDFLKPKDLNSKIEGSIEMKQKQRYWNKYMHCKTPVMASFLVQL